MIILIKLTIDLSVSYSLIKDIRFISFKIYTFEQYFGIPARFCVVLESLIAGNMLSLDYFSHGKRRSTTQNMMAQCSWIFQKLSNDCIPHDLLIAKLEANGLDQVSFIS